ncbi:MAG: hypothetical protein ACREXR_22015 [Gammaproteobacteria bacterium]
MNYDTWHMGEYGNLPGARTPEQHYTEYEAYVQAAERAALKTGEVPSFDLTPELRAAALRGLPLFSRVPLRGDVFGPYSDIDELRRKARQYAHREYLGRPKIETIQSTGETVIIPWQGVKHTIATAFDEATLKMVPHCQRLFAMRGI